MLSVTEDSCRKGTRPQRHYDLATSGRGKVHGRLGLDFRYSFGENDDEFLDKDPAAGSEQVDRCYCTGRECYG